MEEKLSIISESIINRRIKQEIENLINSNICLKDDITIMRDYKPNSSNFNGYILQIYNLTDDKHYSFFIHKYYPFTPPKININNKPIDFCHKIKSIQFRNSLKKYTGIECFCCESVICSNNWTPTLSIKDILVDIKKYFDATHQVIIRIIIDVIKRKYLIDDINIIEWLY